MKWQKTIGWVLAVTVAAVLIAAIGGYVYLKSNAFREFAIGKIVEQANQATGGRTQIRAFDFELSSLTAHLYNIVVRGNDPPDTPPLLQIDKLTVGLKIQSILRRKITLRELLIEHPVIHVQLDRDGKNNIPQAPPSPSNTHTSIFDLAVGHAGISRGEINYNDTKTPLDAELSNLQMDVAFEPWATRYRGSVSYDSGRLRYGKYAPLSHSFAANFNATPSDFSIDSASVRVASSTLTLHGRLANYSHPVVAGDYELRLHAQDFSELASKVQPAGDIFLKGQLNYRDEINQNLIQSVDAEGEIASEKLTAVSGDTRMEMRKLQGKYRLAHGTLLAKTIKAELLGGKISVDAEVKRLDATPSSRIHAALQGVSLRAAQQFAGNSKMNRVSITGSVDGMADASWIGNVNNVRAHSDLYLRSGKVAASPSAREIPVDGVVHANYDGPSGILALRQTILRIPSATLTAEGQVSKHSSLQIHATSNDLRQLVELASAFRPTSAAPPLVSGSGTLNATVHGSMQNPEILAQVSSQNLHVEGSDWKNVEVSLRSNQSQIAISKAILTNVRRGSASLDGSIGLKKWSYLPSNPIRTNVSFRQMPLAELQKLANVRYPVVGDLSGNISVNGSQLDPKGSGSLDVSNGRVYDETIQSLSFKFHTENGAVVSTLNVGTNAGSASSSLNFVPRNKSYKVRLDAPSIALQKLHAVQERNLAVNGIVSISASGQGTLDDPQLDATIQMPKLELKQKSIAGMRADVHVANQQANLTLDSKVAEAAVRARAHVNLADGYETQASIDSAVIPLDVLLASYGTNVPEGFQGQTEFHATLKGPLKDKTKLEAHVTIPRLNASYQSLQIGAAGPIRADYANSTATLQPCELRGTGTSIRLQGRMPIGGATIPALTAQGSIDARILRIISPDLRSSGTAVVDIRAGGSAKSPTVTGQVRLQDIAFSTADTPLGVDKLNATLDIDNERVQISNLSAQAGGGQISAGGSIAYRPSLQFNIAVKGNSVRLRYPEGLRTVLDSNLTLTGNMQASSLKGRVLIDSMSFTPDFDLATFGDQFSSNAATPAQPGFADTVSLQVAVQSQDNLSATSSQVSLEGSADLRVTGTIANPVITGRTDLTSGELFFRNVRYELQRGLITFDDPNRTKPVLDVSVTTTVEQYNLTLNLRGPFDMLTTSYSSDPPLATADVINLIARGKTTSESAASSQSTDSMIASQAASQFSGGVQKLAGISSLQIDPLFGSNSQNPSARVAIQQRVSKKFLFTFSTDPSQPGNETVQGDYQINKRWSVSVARDQLGGVSVDGRFHTKF